MPPSVSDLLQSELLPLRILPTLESNPRNKGLEPVALLFPHFREMRLGVDCKVLFPLTCSLFLWSMNPKFSSAYLHIFSKQETLTTSTISLTSRLVSRTCRPPIRMRRCLMFPACRVQQLGYRSMAVLETACIEQSLHQVMPKPYMDLV